MISREETQDHLIGEVDRLSAKVRELREEEVEARSTGSYLEAERLKEERRWYEAKYGEAYKAYVSGRPEVVDIPIYANRRVG